MREESIRQLTAHMHAMNEVYGKLGQLPGLLAAISILRRTIQTRGGKNDARLARRRIQLGLGEMFLSKSATRDYRIDVIRPRVTITFSIAASFCSTLRL